MELGAMENRGTGKTTHFAPADRAPAASVFEQLDRVITNPIVRAVLESLGGYVAIINKQRQILAASPELRDILLASGCENFVGQRPGEALGCVNAKWTFAGCGTAPQCSHCGALIAILAAQCSEMPVEEECWITVRRNGNVENVEFRARATPLPTVGEDLMVLVLHDISSQKRRVVLERKFLHQTRNLLSGIVTWSEVLDHENHTDATRTIRDLAFQLRDLVVRQSVIEQAEKGQLIVRREKVSYDILIAALSASFSRTASMEGKQLVFHGNRGAEPVVCDRNVLLSVLGNMVENAIEATSAGGTVDIRHELHQGRPSFVVHNPGVIPEEVAERIFQRSFTTKTEPGRGMGTYTMRLLTQQGLGGEVFFTTSAKAGTAFRVVLPAANGSAETKPTVR